MTKPSTIALLSDFGIIDSYVGELKGVILSINPQANIVDITHSIEPQNILQASLILKRAVSFFPRQTIFLCVVDPEVGSPRKIIFVEGQDYNLIAPDNGLLWLTANDLDIRRIVSLENYVYFLNSQPSTFDGRDKMAPVAAYASLGIEPGQFGPTQSGIAKLELPASDWEKDRLIGEIIYFDNFGNAITNISFEKLLQYQAATLPHVLFRNKEIGYLVSSFADVESGSALAYIGSSGFLELAINMGSFRRTHKVEKGEKVVVRLA